MSSSLKTRYENSALFGSNAPTVEALYEQFLDDPSALDDAWRLYFEGIADGAAAEIAHGPVRAEFERRARAPRMAAAVAPEAQAKQTAVIRLITYFRRHGHLLASLDPLGLQPKPRVPDLEPAFVGLADADMDTEFETTNLAGTQRAKLRDILKLCRTIYCHTVGAEFMHISDTEERAWFRDRFERAAVQTTLDADEQRTLLRQLTGAEGIERYLHTRYVGQKRFSLEGGESLIPLLDDLIHQGGQQGAEEIVIAMAHRGRLNVLVNVLGKAPKDLFSEFEGIYDPVVKRGSGDVKYHMGFSSDIRTKGGDVHVALAFNPSHLEIVNPVVEGSVRARQERRGDVERRQVIPVLIHGDSAFAAQGVVMETFQMSQARSFATGGTLHVICNNQIGFTTSDPADTRSTPYCSDVAKMLEAPVLHVNADDPEAVLFCTRVALDYRMQFKKDVVIDLVCYRRHGHNEADEPAATQPWMYKKIREHKPVRRLYAESLTARGVIEAGAEREMVDQYRADVDEGHPLPDAALGMIGDEYTVDWSVYLDANLDQPVGTGITPERLDALAAAVTHEPDGLTLHSRVARIVADRRKMRAGEIPCDWGFAETLAYASLLTSGYAVRLTGQDSGRGTFFHRHAVWHNQDDVGVHIPLQHLADDQGRFLVTDSLLSEEAVLGFEYGYATTEPNALVIWEGQFGDFVNGAQVVIDQFISSGEAKWGRLCGLVMFLPHGYEGQGPEHSSARLERFLQLCAEWNMQVCVPSTPAQMFHMLRRQMLRPVRKPLIVMTPKSLLRHKESVSALDELTAGQFHLLIDDPAPLDAARIERIVLCSGKVYYDLVAARREREQSDVAIVRIEQLYPFPVEEYAALFHKYRNVTEIVWCQEEPQNQGAWYSIRHRLQEPLMDDQALFYAGRAGAAAPACGYYHLHVQQQEGLVAAALRRGNEEE